MWFDERRVEEVVRGVGLHRAAGGISVVVVHYNFQPVVADNLFALVLNRVMRNDVDAHVEHGKAVDGALPGPVILADVGDRRTEGRKASASSGIEKLGKDDVAGKITHTDGCARAEDAPRHIGKWLASVHREIGNNLPSNIVLGLTNMNIRQQPENCQKQHAPDMPAHTDWRA